MSELDKSLAWELYKGDLFLLISRWDGIDIESSTYFIHVNNDGYTWYNQDIEEWGERYPTIKQAKQAASKHYRGGR